MIVYTPIRANVLGIDKTHGALLLSVVGIVAYVFIICHLFNKWRIHY